MIKGRCSRDLTFFAMRFVQQPTGGWELQQGYPLSEESGQKKGHGERSIDGEISVGASYAGCPSCQDRALFFCPNCQTINCQGSGFIQGGNLIVHCAACGSPGCVQGDVQSLDGFLEHPADVPVVIRRPGVAARQRMAPGTRKICAVLRLQKGNQGNLAHRFPDIPARFDGARTPISPRIP